MSATNAPPCGAAMHVKSVQSSNVLPSVWCGSAQSLSLLHDGGSPVVKVSDHGRHVMSSSPVPLKTRRVEKRCTLNLSRAQTFSRWCGVVVRREGCQLSDEAHFWLNGYVNKQNCRIWSEANPQVYVETPLHPEKLTVWCALWAGGILLQKR
ncbi:uncharacterized protein TNCV_2482741 [Trichonephila clavipes]|uniref:Uncharacterized protein n=1 Tax=Trichonephila clavipes TaxID=2585209 RepID=A0A8X6VZ50_TRICX|nr:uncharacterized protein TNCV_2482741 [Trichonephila clavipes]